MARTKTKIRNEDFAAIGIDKTSWIKVFGKAGKEMLKQKLYSKKELLVLFRRIIELPESFNNPGNSFKELADFVISANINKKQSSPKAFAEISLKKAGSYPVFGKKFIDVKALDQMDTAMSLPISKAGALMPDAHVGYGLPIGGVLATEADKVIPYAVGVDIACRMCMTVFKANPDKIDKESKFLKNALIANTSFGVGSETKTHFSSSIFDRSEWAETKVIRDNRDLAYRQLGSSGAGNHFVEWGMLDVPITDAEFGLPAGNYITLLSHSGSRGFGANVAGHYSKIAQEKCRLPSNAKHLAWLDLYSEEGQEYWKAMNLAGEYASANHHEIHNKIIRDVGWPVMKTIENHHNFAWKEKLADGTPVMVHRKGATPAGRGDVGIIPGSMTRPGFVIRGKGYAPSLNSASHGAGRSMSRNQAIQSITARDMIRMVREAGIELIGGYLDEAPVVYKDIEVVMQYQQEMVDVLAKFTPKIVRMADPEKWARRKAK